jgi:hypothetical protein
VALVFDSLISSCELVNCQGIEMQVKASWFDRVLKH